MPMKFQLYTTIWTVNKLQLSIQFAFKHRTVSSSDLNPRGGLRVDLRVWCSNHNYTRILQKWIANWGLTRTISLSNEIDLIWSSKPMLSDNIIAHIYNFNPITAMIYLITQNQIKRVTLSDLSKLALPFSFLYATCPQVGMNEPCRPYRIHLLRLSPQSGVSPMTSEELKTTACVLKNFRWLGQAEQFFFTI